MTFHRKTVPSYFGGLPATHDYLNNADAGTPAPASPQQSGGTYDGTYLVVPTDQATAANMNRGSYALADNDDYLDDVVNASRPVPKQSDATSVGAVDSIVISDEVFVGKVGTADTQNQKDQLVLVLDQNNRRLVSASGVPIAVVAIEDGSSTSVVGQEASGFHTDPTVFFSPSIPATTDYRLLYSTRGTVVSESNPAGAGSMGDVVGRVVSGAGLPHAATVPFLGGASLSQWATGAGLASGTVQSAIHGVVYSLGTSPGASRVGFTANAAQWYDSSFITDTDVQSAVEAVVAGLADETAGSGAAAKIAFPAFAGGGEASFPARAAGNLETAVSELEANAAHLGRPNTWTANQTFEGNLLFDEGSHTGKRVRRIELLSLDVQYTPSIEVFDHFWIDASGATGLRLVSLRRDAALLEGETLRLVMLASSASFNVRVESQGGLSNPLFSFALSPATREWAEFSWDPTLGSDGEWILTAHG